MAFFLSVTLVVGNPGIAVCSTFRPFWRTDRSSSTSAVPDCAVGFSGRGSGPRSVFSGCRAGRRTRIPCRSAATTPALRHRCGPSGGSRPPNRRLVQIAASSPSPRRRPFIGGTKPRRPARTPYTIGLPPWILDEHVCRLCPLVTLIWRMGWLLPHRTLRAALDPPRHRVTSRSPWHLTP